MSSTIIERINTFNADGRWLGYAFKMNDKSKNITCKIDNSENCCERFGCYTNSNISDFIGAEYFSVDVGELVVQEEPGSDLMATIELCIHTDRGKINIYFYNEHNGYYRHDVYIESEHGKKHVSL